MGGALTPIARTLSLSTAVWGVRSFGASAPPGSRDHGFGFRVQGSRFRVQGSGFRVQGPGFRVQGSGSTVQGSGFRVQGSGSKLHGGDAGLAAKMKANSHQPSGSEQTD